MRGRTPYKDEKRKAIFEIMEQFPDAPTRQLTRIIFGKIPEYFTDYESCRTYIRQYRGQCGIRSRNTYKERRFYKPIQKV